MSGIHEGTEFDVAATAAGSGETGVPHGALLLRLVEAAMGADPTALDDARAEVARVMGQQALIEAAAIIANFCQMVRIADGSGIPLDAPLDAASQQLREEIGSVRFGSATNTPAAGTAKRWLAGVVMRWTRPLQPLLLRVMAKRGAFRDQA